ncbi:hypothetical protein RRG08_048043 [Elysia crispata]|uniref:Uncharacterized protein n=1 Tax=Elysia crispata TaxID=231223 RepID=A0AAE0Z2J5_9GAST|nr:hypothetical protein RRG08_048043 [Elysia crispata]
MTHSWTLMEQFSFYRFHSPEKRKKTKKKEAGDQRRAGQSTRAEFSSLGRGRGLYRHLGQFLRESTVLESFSNTEFGRSSISLTSGLTLKSECQELQPTQSRPIRLVRCKSTGPVNGRCGAKPWRQDTFTRKLRTIRERGSVVTVFLNNGSRPAAKARFTSRSTANGERKVSRPATQIVTLVSAAKATQRDFNFDKMRQGHALY